MVYIRTMQGLIFMVKHQSILIVLFVVCFLFFEFDISTLSHWNHEAQGYDDKVASILLMQYFYLIFCNENGFIRNQIALKFAKGPINKK